MKIILSVILVVCSFCLNIMLEDSRWSVLLGAATGLVLTIYCFDGLLYNIKK